MVKKAIKNKTGDSTVPISKGKRKNGKKQKSMKQGMPLLMKRANFANVKKRSNIQHGYSTVVVVANLS